MSSIKEGEMVLPTMYLLSRRDQGLTTSQLITELENLLKPTGEDLEILSGRNDSKFSQKVRNLISHRTLTRRGLVSGGENRNAPLRISVIGRQFLNRHERDFEALLPFDIESTGQELSQMSEDIETTVVDEVIITEGLETQSVSTTRSRSLKLRDAAIEYYRQEYGRLICDGCGFDFERAYPGRGEGYIQIHHLKPVSLLGGAELVLSEAIQNVRPLCGNCHLMVHRARPALTMSELRGIVNVTYNYER